MHNTVQTADVKMIEVSLYYFLNLTNMCLFLVQKIEINLLPHATVLDDIALVHWSKNRTALDNEPTRNQT